MALTPAEVKADQLRGAVSVRRIWCGLYVVPSATEVDATHTVTGPGSALANYS